MLQMGRRTTRVKRPATVAHSKTRRADPLRVSAMMAQEDAWEIVQQGDAFELDEGLFAGRSPRSLSSLPFETLPDGFSLVVQEVNDLRSDLLAEFGTSTSARMLADDAVIGLMLERIYCFYAQGLLHCGDTNAFRQVERLERLAEKAHRRFLGAMTALQRGRRLAVNITVGTVGNMCIGNQHAAREST